MNRPEDFVYPLPTELIAHEPLQQRDTSRLLRYQRQTHRSTHHHFTDLPNFLQPGDLLVRNNSKVIPARLTGTKASGGNVEVLLNSPVATSPYQWQCLVKPGLKAGQMVSFAPQLQATSHGSQPNSVLTILEFNQDRTALLRSLESIGHVPLPHYIHSQLPEKQLKERYQTYYAQPPGSVAAPTAGLHFSPAIDQALTARGIDIAEITLHVGYGTFAPLKPEVFATNQLHYESFSMHPDVAEQIKTAKIGKRRIIAVGTTTVRTLESCWDVVTQDWRRIEGETNLLIAPPYSFGIIDALITNFHLPKSSLLALISAFTTTPQTNEIFSTFDQSQIGAVYQLAIAEQYRFFSFGDAMLIE